MSGTVLYGGTVPGQKQHPTLRVTYGWIPYICINLPPEATPVIHCQIRECEQPRCPHGDVCQDHAG